MTLFPEMCKSVLGESIVGRARAAGLLEIHCRDIRAYTLDKHRRVDDTPYGGGMGMLLQADPIDRCFSSICEETGERPRLITSRPRAKRSRSRGCGSSRRCRGSAFCAGITKGWMSV